MNQITGRTIGAVVALLLISVGVVYAGTTTTIGDFFAGGNITAKQIGGVIYADQYATIQDAINYSLDSNKLYATKPVFIPAGVYYLSSPLILYDNSILLGAGRNLTKLVAINTSYFYDSANQERGMIELASAFTTNPNKSIYIAHLSIDGNISNINPTKITNKNPLSGIKLGWVTQATVEDVEVHDVASFGIGVWGKNTGTTIAPMSSIKNNYIYNITYNSDGLLTDGRFSSGIFTSNNINFGVDISGNHIWNVANGIESEDGAAQDIISNNYITNGSNISGAAGIQTTNGGYDGSIIGNIITSTYDGINLKYGTGTKVIGNTLLNQFKNGIVLGGSLGGQQIIGNTIRNANATGISVLTGVSGATILSNDIESVGINTSETPEDRSGIRLQAPDNKVIANTIYDLDGVYTMTWAINMSSGTGLLVTENRIVPAHFTIGTISVPTGNMVYNNPGLSPMNFGNSANCNAITAYGDGDTCGNTTDHFEYRYNGTAWNVQTQNAYTELFIGNGATKNFSTTYKILPSSSNVYINGSKQVVGASYDYQEFTQSVNLTSAPVNNARIEVDYAQG